jgi:hypothetical protein
VGQAPPYKTDNATKTLRHKIKKENPNIEILNKHKCSNETGNPLFIDRFVTKRYDTCDVRTRPAVKRRAKYNKFEVSESG